MKLETDDDGRKVTSPQNGLKGGVKTDEGKAASSKNAIKHGLLSNSLSEYDRVPYSAMYAHLAQEFNVETLYQRIILEQLVVTYIKLARCSRLESELLNQEIKTYENPNSLDKYIEEACSNISSKRLDPEDKALIDEKTFKNLDLILTRYEPQLNSRILTLIKVLLELKRQV